MLSLSEFLSSTAVNTILRMVANIEKKRINMVIVKDLSRLGRNYVKVGNTRISSFPSITFGSLRWLRILIVTTKMMFRVFSMLKGISQNGLLTEKKINELIVSKVKAPPKQVKISHKIIWRYLTYNITHRSATA